MPCAPAGAHDLVSPKVIKRDDVVAVVFEADGVSLTLQAKAMGDCSAGDTVEVVNPQSKKVIETVCSGPGQAVVGPRADEIKAANSPSGGQGRLVTASLR
jgi:flagella basal body P-ring formation protein FlgA